MKLHILHDDGLWSPPHPISTGSLELRQYSTCKLCGRIRHRTIGLAAQGRFDVEIANGNRTETLSALPADGSVQRHLLHVEERVHAIERHLVL